MTTVANVRKSESSHWYHKDGTPCYEMPKKSGGMRQTTLADARDLGLLPSVTTILKVLNKPALNDWIEEQVALAVLTTPRLPKESMDEFVNRVLRIEKIQEQEAKLARDKGKAIHDAIECCLMGEHFDVAWRPYVEAVLPVLKSLGKVVWAEKVLVNAEAGYAGKADVGLETDRHIALLDFKTSKRMPKESYPEHRLQTAAYAKAHGLSADKHIITGNLYISTVLPGTVELCLQDQWEETYEQGFKPLLQYWQFANSYVP